MSGRRSPKLPDAEVPRGCHSLRTRCLALSTALGALGELDLETLELRHDLRPCSPSSRCWSVSHFLTRLGFVVNVVTAVEVRRASVRRDALTEGHVHGHLTTAQTGVR